MKKVWMRNIALAMGLCSATTAWAQYPNYNTNTGPSAYPVQHQAPNYQLSNWQESVPSVPAPGAYDVPAPPANGVGPAVTNPIPIAPQYAPQPAQGYAHQPTPGYAPQPQPMHYSQQQAVAPGCTSCGSAPVSQPYATYAAPQYAFSAPSVGYGSCNSCGPSVVPHARAFGNGLPPGAKPYFFGANALIFRRIDDYNRLLSVNDTTGAGILYTQDAKLGTMAGFELMGGRYFNCGKNAIAVSYWGLFPESQSTTVVDGGNGVRSRLWRPWVGPNPNTGEYQLQMAPAANVATDPDIYNVYDTATTHYLTRSSRFHNIEINLLGFAVGGASRNFNRATAGSMFAGRNNCGYGSCGPCGYADACGSGYGDCGSCAPCEDTSRYATGPCSYVAPGCGSKLNLTWIAGVRYLQFYDNLMYSATGGPTLGANTISYDVNTRNHLVGFQIGGRTDYCVTCKMNLYGLAKAGIYGNNASLMSRLASNTYNAYASNDPTMPFSISRSSNTVAFLSELGTGVGYCFTPKWSATVGYRAIIASGVATSVGNIRHQGDTISGTGINAHDCLILHGLNVGALYNF